MMPEAVTHFVQALVVDDELREWFESLAEFPEADRATEFLQMATRIRESGEHEEIAHATALLATPGVYESVREAMLELLEEE